MDDNRGGGGGGGGGADKGVHFSTRRVGKYTGKYRGTGNRGSLSLFSRLFGREIG